MTKFLKSKDFLWGIALFAIFTISFSYIFDSKLNLNGDNCYYFANATSLARGDGYADMFGKPTTNFPPGYPLLMAPLRMVTDSIVAQKILNGVFLFVGVMLLFSTIVRAGFKRSLAFLACSAVLAAFFVRPHSSRTAPTALRIFGYVLTPILTALFLIIKSAKTSKSHF